MDSSRRWITVFTGIIGVLIIAAILLVLLPDHDNVTLLPEDTPQGTVQRYLLAVQDEDYEEAYDYLYFNGNEKILTLEEWLPTVTVYRSTSYRSPDEPVWKASLGDVVEKGDYAAVQVIIDTFRASSIFEDPVYSRDINFQLNKIGGVWLITSPTYIYWIY